MLRFLKIVLNIQPWTRPLGNLVTRLRTPGAPKLKMKAEIKALVLQIPARLIIALKSLPEKSRHLCLAPYCSKHHELKKEKGGFI